MTERRAAGVEQQHKEGDELLPVFYPRCVQHSAGQRGLALANESFSNSGFESAGLLGSLFSPATSSADADAIFLNTHEPFCLATVGVQGSGKSHTLAVVLENCLLPYTYPQSRPLVRLNRPMSALMLHYDQNESSICEVMGLVAPDPSMKITLQCHLPRDRLVVVVSPSNYLQRKQFYGDNFTVKPLLFRWNSLSADHLKRLMRIKENDQQLYMACMLDLLRQHQRRGEVPSYTAFASEIRQLCKIPGQMAALTQRLNLLNSLIYESEDNASLRKVSSDVTSSLEDGTLVLVDLTDPLCAAEEVNGIFQVITEKFRAAPHTNGRVLMLDEAHRFMDGTSSDGLSCAIVNAARLMRHDGLRVIVSTQSPKALAPELLELVSVAVLHRFHSRDWHNHLSAKIPLNDHHFEECQALQPGEALVFAGLHGIIPQQQQPPHQHVFAMKVRPRLTADLGASRNNDSLEHQTPSPGKTPS